MKKITCLDCDKEFELETKEDAIQAMMPHYMSEHNDVMAAGTEESKKEWFAELDRRWEAAEEV